MDRNSTFRLLTDIFWKIIIFAKNLIDTGICDLNSINAYIEGKIDSFSDHISTVNTSFLLKNEEKGVDGDRDVFVFPIDDLVISDYINLGKLLIIPAGFLNECRQDRNKCLGLEEYYIDRMLTDNMIRQNNEVAFVLLKGMPDVNNLKVMSQLLGVSVDYLLDDEEKFSFNEIKEAINLDDYEKTGRCRDKKDAVCVVKNKDASAIYALFPTKKMTKAEWIVDFVVQPGVVEVLDRFKELAGYYLVEKGNKQYFVKVTNEFIVI